MPPDKGQAGRRSDQSDGERREIAGAACIDQCRPAIRSQDRADAAYRPGRARDRGSDIGLIDVGRQRIERGLAPLVKRPCSAIQIVRTCTAGWPCDSPERTAAHPAANKVICTIEMREPNLPMSQAQAIAPITAPELYAATVRLASARPSLMLVISAGAPHWQRIGTTRLMRLTGGIPAINYQLSAGDEFGLIRGQIHSPPCDIVDFANMPQRMQRIDRPSCLHKIPQRR